MQKFKNGATVYVNSAYDICEKCIVKGFIENKSSTGKSLCVVSSTVHGGTFDVTEERVFATWEEAFKAELTGIHMHEEECYENDCCPLLG